MRVLIAEDDPVSRRVLEAALKKWGYDVLVACDGDEAWQVFEAGDGPRLAVLDWMMPGKDGVEVSRLIRERGDEDYVYIIMLTAKGQKQDLIEGMAAGADDYVTKPFDAGELRVRIRAAQRILDLQDEIIAARESLREQATHDMLTGLLNRPAIIDTLQRALDYAEREGSTVGVVMADLDHFKQINDTHGHKAGDTVLREASRRMRSVLRTYDSIGRYGGEEFLLVLPGCDEDGSMALAERVRCCLAGEPIRLCDDSLDVTVSLGVSVVQGGEHTSADSAIHAADDALYRAKDAGRNRCECDRRTTAGAC
ncbi:MAG: GGDEF domain-containing response regulator [Phycisphaerae bacterium]